MSNSDLSDINKEEYKQKNEENQKEREKEKETSNLLEENRNQETALNLSFISLEKGNEVIGFILLAIFAIVIYLLAKLKPAKRGVFEIKGNKIIENSFFHEIESTDLVNSFENRFKNCYPEITLELKNEFPTLEQIFNSRILYLFNRKNITNKYLRHLRKIDEDEEGKFKQELYPNLIPNDTFSEQRDNFININTFIDICNKGKLINTEKITSTDKPLVTIIIPVYNKRNEITKTIRSIQNQSLKNIEIIIVDDFSTENATDIYNKLLNEDKRIRVFYHMFNTGTFRTRLDGFLYSRGKYILFFNPGDLFSDNLILEDMYKFIIKYNLDSVRFSYLKFKLIENNQYQIFKHSFSTNDLKIQYGKIKLKSGYKTICNRLIRANTIIRGLDLVDGYILNAVENIWEDCWWNEIVNGEIFGHVDVNRVGYLYFSPLIDERDIKISTEEERDKTIKEFIYSWLLEYQLTRADSMKKGLLKTLKQYNTPGNKFNNKTINLDYLRTNFTVYTRFLNLLIDDFFIDDVGKKYVGQLLSNYTDKINNITYYLNNLNKKSNFSFVNGL